MNTVIWKFDIPLEDYSKLSMPKGANVIHAEAHETPGMRELGIPGDRHIKIWAEVDPAAPVETRRFAVYGTGHERRHERQKYLGTSQFANGQQVYHLYEVLQGNAPPDGGLNLQR